VTSSSQSLERCETEPSGSAVLLVGSGGIGKSFLAAQLSKSFFKKVVDDRTQLASLIDARHAVSEHLDSLCIDFGTTNTVADLLGEPRRYHRFLYVVPPIPAVPSKLLESTPPGYSPSDSFVNSVLEEAARRTPKTSWSHLDLLSVSANVLCSPLPTFLDSAGDDVAKFVADMRNAPNTARLIGWFRSALRALSRRISHLLRSLIVPDTVRPETVLQEIPWYLVHGCHPPEIAPRKGLFIPGRVVA
jgi:hypothetical protein